MAREKFRIPPLLLRLNIAENNINTYKDGKCCSPNLKKRIIIILIFAIFGCSFLIK